MWHFVVLFVGLIVTGSGGWGFHQVYRSVKDTKIGIGQTEILKPIFVMFAGLILSALSFAIEM